MTNFSPSLPNLLLTVLALGLVVHHVTPAYRDAAKRTRRWLFGLLVALCMQAGLFVFVGRRIPAVSFIVALMGWFALLGWSISTQSLHTSKKPTRPE